MALPPKKTVTKVKSTGAKQPLNIMYAVPAARPSKARVHNTVQTVMCAINHQDCAKLTKAFSESVNYRVKPDSIRSLAYLFAIEKDNVRAKEVLSVLIVNYCRTSIKPSDLQFMSLDIDALTGVLLCKVRTTRKEGGVTHNHIYKLKLLPLLGDIRESLGLDFRIHQYLTKSTPDITPEELVVKTKELQDLLT